MKGTIKALIFATMALFFSNVFAAKDPISWQLDAPFPDSVLTGGTYTITYTFTNQLPMRLINPLAIEKIASPVSEFTYNDTCTGQRLSPQQSCTVQVILTSIITGKKSVQLVIAGYDKNRVPLPLITTLLSAQPSANIRALVTDSLPATLAVADTANYAFTFTNTGSETATSVSLQVSNPGFATTCTNQLAIGQSCTVSGSYTPQSNVPTVQTVSATFSYAEGSPATALTSTSITGAPLSGVVGTLVSPNYLPPVMVGGPTQTKTLQFLFRNYNTTPVVINSRAVSAPGANFTIGTNPGDDSCSNSPTLPLDGACQILGTYTVPIQVTPTAFTATASVDYSDVGGSNPSTSSVSTSTTVVLSIANERVMTFVNQCTFPVWFSLHGGALVDSPVCNSSLDCPTGTSCNTETKICYWYNYEPVNNNYELAPGGGTNTVTIPLTSVSSSVQWSGNFSASTLCDNSTETCGQAACGNKGGTTSCAPGIGFSQPATQAEITMLIYEADSYDVEVINGFHLPMKMEPGPYVTPDNYSCGIPGNETAANGFGACDWSLATTPSNAYYWVTSGGAACGSGCSAGNLCGLDSALNQVCGAFLGYWTANQACSVNATKAQPFFGCTNPLTTPFSSGQLQQLMACSPPIVTAPAFNSCYLDYPGYNAASIAQCCGCVDWWQLGGVGANPNAQSCTKPGQTLPQTDPVWLNSILPTIQWMKTTCPSLYTYPYDDATSGFSCSNNLPQSPNSVGYTITFCAGDNTGLPPGGSITDGRIP